MLYLTKPYPQVDGKRYMHGELTVPHGNKRVHHYIGGRYFLRAP